MYAPKAAILVTAAALGSGLCAVNAYAATDEGTQSCTREQERANKAVVVNGFGGGFDSFFKSLDPNYKQHSPEFKRFGEINGVQGAKVFDLMGEAFKLTGQGGVPKPVAGQPPGNNQYMILAQCDLVTIVATTFEPDPQYPGKFYETFRFDVFRVKDGKLAEHWDGGKIPNPAPEYLKKPVTELRAQKAKEASSGSK